MKSLTMALFLMGISFVAGWKYGYNQVTSEIERIIKRVLDRRIEQTVKQVLERRR